MSDFTVLVASGGRRPYLVRWFREALRRNRVAGRVVVADLDPCSPAAAVADAFVAAMPVVDPGYGDWLEATLRREAVTLAVSINDFELSRWARLEDRSAFDALVRLDARRQRTIEDKLAMAQLLADTGVTSPETLLASTALRLGPDALKERLGADEFVVKGRYGSGSRGLGFARAASLHEAIARARAEVTHRDGRGEADPDAADELIVVQPRLQGTEHGVDVVTDLRGGFATALVRRKIAMRAGETDRAESVDATPYLGLARGVARALGHRGLVDLDVIRTDAGLLSVIDVNPRFGGGYPLSHVAGADIPAAYVAWALGRTPDADWLRARPGTIAAKAVEVLAVAHPEPEQARNPPEYSHGATATV
ncbi:ATP-grasp domain-containing protein [Gulosibacter sediminis]|uniref:ATP-grasp domain-containing protein n=1 Tax=Gulosibacter sediminis TaxID=1729695 RepID=UPI0024AE7FAA|nr:ATP-grasp domain-containing protein [Gulosibacter sediminis]